MMVFHLFLKSGSNDLCLVRFLPTHCHTRRAKALVDIFFFREKNKLENGQFSCIFLSNHLTELDEIWSEVKQNEYRADAKRPEAKILNHSGDILAQNRQKFTKTGLNFTGDFFLAFFGICMLQFA